MLLAACSPQQTVEAAPSRSEPAPLANDASLQSEERGHLGLWQVSTIDGAPLGQHHPIYLLVGRSGGEGQSQCIPLDFNWPFMDRPLAFRKRARLPDGTQPPISTCARGLSETERALERLLPLAQRFVAPSPGQLAVDGPGGAMSLVRPSEPPLNPSGWSSVAPELLWGEWRVAELDGRPVSFPMHLLVFRHRLELLSGCVGIGRLFAASAQPTRGQLPGALPLVPDPGLRTTCERMPTPDETRADAILTGTLEQTLIEPGRRILTGPNGSLTLVR